MTPQEAAARAWFDRTQNTRMDAGGRRPDGSRWRWDDLTDHDRNAYLALVAPIVTAALEAYGTAPGCDAVSPESGIPCTERSGHPGEHVSFWKERWAA